VDPFPCHPRRRKTSNSPLHQRLSNMIDTRFVLHTHLEFIEALGYDCLLRFMLMHLYAALFWALLGLLLHGHAGALVVSRFPSIERHVYMDIIRRYMGSIVSPARWIGLGVGYRNVPPQLCSGFVPWPTFAYHYHYHHHHHHHHHQYLYSCAWPHAYVVNNQTF
jgi:hypothetical protein